MLSPFPPVGMITTRRLSPVTVPTQFFTLSETRPILPPVLLHAIEPAHSWSLCRSVASHLIPTLLPVILSAPMSFSHIQTIQITSFNSHFIPHIPQSVRVYNHLHWLFRRVIHFRWTQVSMSFGEEPMVRLHALQLEWTGAAASQFCNPASSSLLSNSSSTVSFSSRITLTSRSFYGEVFINLCLFSGPHSQSKFKYLFLCFIDCVVYLHVCHLLLYSQGWSHFIYVNSFQF